MRLKALFSNKANMVLLAIFLGLLMFMGVIVNFIINVQIYNSHILKHNSLVERYNACLNKVDVSNIPDISSKIEPKQFIENSLGGYLQATKKGLGPFSINEKNSHLAKTVASDISGYLVGRQIYNPQEDWIISRMEQVEDIREIQAVTKDKDPNQLLGKKDGYTSCVYFSHKAISSDTIEGKDIVEKGTDCGGAIEVFANKESAEMRCEYLKMFDNTYMYSGSYAIIGTMVIRTSALLPEDKQLELTEKLVAALTKVEDFKNWENER